MDRLPLLLAVLVAVGCHSRQVCPTVDVAKLRQVAREPLPPDTGEVCLPPSPPRHVLAVSGGGMYGAYTAGFLAGWTKAGTRPQFDVVTGISTGSLIASAAFLGPRYDDVCREFYTAVRAADIYSSRAWVLIPWSDSLASSRPLKQLIDAVVDDHLIAAVAAEYRKGRRLYVGTTHLASRKLVIWDMGAVAAKGGAGAVERFRAILLASCSVPGMLPPVKLTSVRNGQTVTEWHADGGVAAPVFVPPGVLAVAADGSPSGTNLYVLISGKLFADPGPVRPRVLPVLSASASGVLYAHTRSEVASLFHLSRLTGGNFHLAALPDSDNGETLGLSFDPREMSRLFEVGYCQGVGGPVWMTAPPFEGAATDPPRE